MTLTEKGKKGIHSVLASDRIGKAGALGKSKQARLVAKDTLGIKQRITTFGVWERRVKGLVIRVAESEQVDLRQCSAEQRTSIGAPSHRQTMRGVQSLKQGPSFEDTR